MSILSAFSLHQGSHKEGHLTQTKTSDKTKIFKAGTDAKASLNFTRVTMSSQVGIVQSSHIISGRICNSK